MMTTLRNTLLAMAIVLPLPGGARAAITTLLAPVPISPAAIAADPNLAGHQTWDLRINVPQNQRWGFSGFDVTLTQGAFYNSPLGGDTPGPQLWGVFPQLRFDTFVTQAADPDDDATFIPPTITSGFPDPPLPVIFDDTRISIVFHGAPGPGFGPGIFTIARLTFSDDAVGTIVGHSVDRPSGETTPFAFVIPVPEPAGVSVVAAVPLVLLNRRRARRGAILQDGSES